MLTAEEIQTLNSILDKLESDREQIHKDSFFRLRSFIQSFGGKIDAVKAPKPPTEGENKIPDDLLSENSEESEIEFENVSIITKEDIPFPESGDASNEVSEEDMDKSSDLRSQGVKKLNEGDLEESLKLFTSSILLNPKSAVVYAKRADCLLRMKRVAAAINDCDSAIKINPDSALAYKVRGLCNKSLGLWEKAFHDFQTSIKIDFSEEVASAIKEVEPMHKRVHEHNQKYERIRRENKIRRVRRAHLNRTQNEPKREESHQGPTPHNSASSGSNGNPFGNLFSDPELMSAMQDPEIMAAFGDIMKNPMNMMKYQGNPKFQKIFSKLQSGMGGGMPGMAGMPGMGGMPGMANMFNKANPNDDELD